MKEFILLSLILLIVGCFAYTIYQQKKNCNTNGGVLAQGVFGFVCVAGVNNKIAGE